MRTTSTSVPGSTSPSSAFTSTAFSPKRTVPIGASLVIVFPLSPTASTADSEDTAFDGTVEGSNDHHKAEAIFKAFAKSIYDACKIEHDEILSTKGVL